MARGARYNRSMLPILAITFPFFALVLCGYLAVRRALLPLAAIGGLNSFVLYCALPCMLYRFGAATPRALRIIGSTATARIARIILVSTALSFLTFSAAVSWLA